MRIVVEDDGQLDKLIEAIRDLTEQVRMLKWAGRVEIRDPERLPYEPYYPTPPQPLYPCYPTVPHYRWAYGSSTTNPAPNTCGGTNPSTAGRA